jgi:hypothetical protein
MLSNPTIGDSDRPIIPIEAGTSTLTLLLDILYRKTEASTPNWVSLIPVVEVVRRYGFEAVSDRITVLAISRVRDTPWAIFRLASQLDLTILAKMALKEMKNDTYMNQTTLLSLTATRVSGVSPAYLIGLVRGMATQTAKVESRTTRGLPVLILDWTAIGEAFEPAP